MSNLTHELNSNWNFSFSKSFKIREGFEKIISDFKLLKIYDLFYKSLIFFRKDLYQIL
jgi:hypothetical protein